MKRKEFYYADDEHSPADEYWFNQQKYLGNVVILQNELIDTIFSLPQESDDLNDMFDMLVMVNGAYNALYEGFCRHGMQYDADLVIHDVLTQKPLPEKTEDTFPDS